MSTKLIVGPIDKGYTTNRLAFNIDNDAFPTLRNAYQWRGRIKRKRGTQLLDRLTRFVNTLISSYSTTSTTITLNGSGVGNLITGFGLQTNSSIVPGTVTLTASGGPTVYTDPTMDGFLTPTGTGGPNLINYANGQITIPAQAGNTVSATFDYYPTLPVMGLEDFYLRTEEFPQTIAFDTVYAYNLLPVQPYGSYSVSFYKNPPTAFYPGYIQKTNWTPLTWNGEDYQQFWSTNYEGALWVTNGIEVPFDPTNIGMQFAPSSSITYISNTATTLTVTIAGSPLVIGDFVFVNEWTGTNAGSLNFLSGYVTAIAPNIVITFPNATIGAGPYAPGIIQYLTNRSDITKDNIRWYDGDPTNGSIIAPGFLPGNGWVNFMPPLSFLPFSVGDSPLAIYYLVGARMILPFKDRLVFFGPVIQTSAAGSQIYLEDAIIYSQNGTPYYTASFPATLPTDVLSSTTVFTPILVPVNRTATPTSYFEDQTGFGGFILSGIDQPINTVSPNEDVLIIGYDTNQVRMVSTGNDIVPFNLFVINSELGATSTFSIVNMDQGVITRGNRGYTITSQTSSQRIDLDNPDQVFEIDNVNNGTERFCAQRDFINEWVYFTYPSNQQDQTQYRFPTETFQFNHRDNSWAIFKETYTTYGAFRIQTGFTWATVGLTYPTWDVWNDPWDAGNSTLLQQTVIAGNQQGFILLRAIGTGEGASLAIQNISGNTITSPDHCLILKDFIVINGVLGAAGQYLNGKIFQVTSTTLNSFTIDFTVPAVTYSGGGTIVRLYVPFIQTKQFPISWGLARKTRIGVQQYLLSKTVLGQITLYLYLSTDSSNPYNFGPIVPDIEPENNALIFSTILYTCPESTNLGLTPANTNLQQLNLIGDNGSSSNNQSQIWHRMNTSLLGDTVQLGFTISDDQMSSYTPILPSFAITGATRTNPAVISTTGQFPIGSLVQITGVLGMTNLNFDSESYNYYYVISSTPTSTTIEVDATGFNAYISGGQIIAVANFNSTTEVELHAMILDVSPSGMLS
jgi:hypothetical protein